MRSIQRIAVLIFLSVGTLALAQPPTIRILEVEPTVLFPNHEPLQQIANLRLLNESGSTIGCTLFVQLSGQTGLPETAVSVPPGVSQQQVLIPDITTATEVKIEVRRKDDGQILATQTKTWQPQRHWKVFVVLSSHEDLGYEKLIQEKQHDIANYIDMANGLSGKASAKADGSYHYTMEKLLLERNYIDERSEADWRQIVDKAIKPGRMYLMGEPSGDHSHWMDYEELARYTYPARREAKDRWGLELKTLMIVDNPSLSWSGCQAAADAGFRYVARWGQGWRTGNHNDYQTTGLPALFWWQAPDGKHRLLYTWRSHYGMEFWYGQPGDGYQGVPDLGAENVNRKLKAIESGSVLGPYPYDALVNPSYTDHDVPHFDGASVLPAWSHAYRYPEIRIASPTEFFEYIEGKYGSEVPVLSGDLNNFSADYATIDPDSQGWKREAARLLPLADGLAAIAGTLDAAFETPARLIERTFTRLFDYDEHSWPTQPEASDVQLFNAQWIKRAEAARALDGAQQAVEIGFQSLEHHVPTGDAPSVLVFNPLGHERTDVVWVNAQIPELVDGETGQQVATQIEGGRTVFVAHGVPAFGYRTFRVVKTSGSVPPPGAGLTVTKDAIENHYYRIQFDHATGAITSILDKELQRELVDPHAPQRFNQLVYVHTKSSVSPEGETYSPSSGAELSGGKAGPVEASFAVKVDDTRTGAAITQTVTLYRDIKRIDIVDDLRHVRTFYSDRYEDRYRDNIYYAFPVKVENFEDRAEYPGGVVRPYVDQLRWGSHDYLMANRWVDVSNSSFGVTMAPWNASTVSFGEIRYNRFSIDYRPTSSYLYSYAYSNRMAGLLTLNGDDCNARLGYSFTSHAGDWSGGQTTAFGWSVASPLEARLLPRSQRGSLPTERASFLSVSAPNVQLVTLKQSEQPGRGWIVRLVETEGRDTDVVVALPRFPITRATECDLVENDRGPLVVAGRKVNLRIGKYAFATLRVWSDDALGGVEGVRAEALSDKSVRLRWNGSAAAYNIYRSEDPDAPPTLYSLVARTTQPAFTDDWLKIATTYYYYVAPVSLSNNQGATTPRVAVTTKTVNSSPPAPVEGLGVVRRAKDRLIVYWLTSPEPDVARYYIYRGQEKDFSITGKSPSATVAPARYFLQTFADSGLEPGRTYYYKVLAEDWAGNRQTDSPVAGVTTPAY